MMPFLIRRLLWFLPTGIIISLLAFALSKSAPGDPVALRNSAVVASSAIESDRLYQETARMLGLDKPAFYFALRSSAHPDTLYRILLKERREAMEILLGQCGNWPAVQTHFQQIDAAFQKASAVSGANAVAQHLRELGSISNISAIQSRLNQLLVQVNSDSILQSNLTDPISRIQEHFPALKSTFMRYQLFIPAWHWYGLDNQYHHWLTGVLKGDFGASYQDGRPVGRKVGEALRWTFRLNLVALLLAFGLAIPLGVRSAQREGGRFDRWATVILFMAYSLPVFWLATLLQVFLTTPEYGLDWFPSSGLSELDAGSPWWQRWSDQAAHIFLPVFCLTLGALAFIARQMRGGMLQVLGMDYIQTARAKGLSERRVIWKHALANALFPLITLIGSVFPSILAGSVVIEVIFGIPGMGKLSVEAIFARDWPVVFTILMMGAGLTMTGIFVSDLLYALADPRVRQGLKK